MQSQSPDPPAPRDVPDEPPPFLGSWGRVYAVVLTYLAGVITLMYIFSVVFTR
jgi:hypothetical protein